MFFKQCISEELQHVESPQEFMRGNYTFMKLVVQTNRGAKERQFFRELFGDLIKQVVNNDFLDLELDLVNIYHKSINDEESRTGMPSTRPHAVTAQDVSSDDSKSESSSSSIISSGVFKLKGMDSSWRYL